VTPNNAVFSFVAEFQESMTFHKNVSLPSLMSKCEKKKLLLYSLNRNFLSANYNYWINPWRLILCFLPIHFFVFNSILMYVVIFFSVHLSGFITTVWISQHHPRADGIVRSVQLIWNEEVPGRISVLSSISFLKQHEGSSLLNRHFIHVI
jgi:hypothetical protein